MKREEFKSRDQVDQTVPDGWSLCIHPRGWIYFYNASLKIVTDQDVRDPEIYNATKYQSTLYPMSELADHMEVQMQVQPDVGQTIFNIAINHEHCVASHDLHEVQDAYVSRMEPNACECFVRSRKRLLTLN